MGILIAVLLPIISAILIGIAVGDIAPRSSVPCLPHTWSYVFMSDKLVCRVCGKDSDIHPLI